MAKKKKVAGAGAAVKPEPKKKEDPSVIFESWLKGCTDEQRQIVSDVDEHLIGIQSDKKDLRREMQPLRVGMELSKARRAITGQSGAASPQKESGRIWGAYRDSHLKDAGYSKSSCDTYVGMIEEARKILPDDNLITTLMDHTNEKGVVLLVGGKVDKPFGKYTKYLKSDEVQQYVKDGKVDLGDQTVDDLVINVFDPDNAEEPPDTLDHVAVAVNTAVKRIFARVKEELKTGKEPFDLKKVVENARDYVRYVVESLLTVCDCPDMKDTFEPKEEDFIETDKLLTLEAVVKEANEKKKASAVKSKATKPKKPKKVAHVRHAEPEKVADIIMGKYTIRKNPKPQFPQTPWEVFENGNDKPVACQDKLQAEQYVEQHLLPKDAPSDRPSSPAPQDEQVRKQQREARAGKEYDAG
jgi:hypothetical protein